jgi:ribosomal protein L7/L12
LQLDVAEVTETARIRVARGDDDESLLAFLRANGCDKVASIKIVRDVKGVRLGEAKRLVHLSHAWQDRRAGDDELHDQLATRMHTDTERRR